MANLSISIFVLFFYSLPLVTIASIVEIDGPVETGSGGSGSGLACDKKYIAFREDGKGLPFKVINNTILIVQTPYQGNKAFLILYFDDGRPVICASPPSSAFFSLPLFIIIYITTSLSIIGSVALLVTYSLFKQLRTLPGQIIMNLAAAFLVGDLLVQIRISHEYHGIYHLASSALQQHLYLARYVWMCLAGIEMSRSIYNGVTLAYDTKFKRWCLLAAYMAFGWGIPTILVSIMVIVEKKGDHNARKWFGVVGHAINIVPLGITLLINIGVVIFLSAVFWNASQRQKRLQSGFKRQKVNFVRIFFIILTVLGLVWISFFILLTWSHHLAIQITFVILTLTQPVVVSVAFICTKKVYRMYLQLFSCQRDFDQKRNIRSGTVTTIMVDKDLSRGRTVVSLISQKELNPPITTTEEPSLAVIEEQEEDTRDVLENNEDTHCEAGDDHGTKIAPRSNGLHPCGPKILTQSTLSQCNGTKIGNLLSNRHSNHRACARETSV